MTWEMAGAILLTLLKILGILLLIILVLIVLLLFVPVRYKVSATFYEEYRVQGRIHWMCFLVRMPFQWQDGQGDWKLRILGIPVCKSTEKTVNSKKRQSRRRKGAGKDRKVSTDTDHGSGDIANQRKQTAEKLQNSVRIENKQQQSEQNNKKHKKDNLFRRIYHRIRDWYQMICRLIRCLKKRIHSFQDLLEILRADMTKRFVCIAGDNMLHLWKQLRPRKIRGDIRLGTGDPCSTGQTLGVIAMFYAWLGSGVHITPDFEEACFEGRLEVRGRISVITLLIVVIRLITNKDFKSLQREWRQWKEDF